MIVADTVLSADAPDRVQIPPNKNSGISHSHDDADWGLRSEFWLTHSPEASVRKKRERSLEPLILCGHGMSLRIEAGTLLIKNGLTHYPQQPETFRFFPGSLERPARIILLDGSGSISFDVLDWLADQEVPLIRISWKGEVVTLAGNGFSADREKVDWQRETRANLEARLEFSCKLVQQKIRNSIETLKSAFPQSETRDRAISKLRSELDGLINRIPTEIDALRGIEGGVGAVYFAPWQGVPLCWKINKRKPIPPEWQTISSRASLLSQKTSKNRNATHPVNAMLNYAYAVLLGQLKIQLVAEGYDPTIGIMHHDYRGGPAFVLDKMEPLRPVVDRVVLGFVTGHTLHPADFILRSDGVCRLNPQLARCIAILVTKALSAEYTGF